MKKQYLTLKVFPGEPVFSEDTLAAVEIAIRRHAPDLAQSSKLPDRLSDTPNPLSSHSLSEVVAMVLESDPRAPAIELAAQSRKSATGPIAMVLSSQDSRGSGPTEFNVVSWQFAYASKRSAQQVESNAKLALRHLTQSLPVEYGYARTQIEFDRKNRTSSSYGARKVIGLELPDRLPGIYWANYIGRRYSDRLNLDRLQQSDLFDIEQTEDGVFIFMKVTSDHAADDEVMAQLKTLEGDLGELFFFPPS